MTTFQPIQFFVPGAPVGKGRPRAARRGSHIALYTPAKTANYENLVKMAAHAVMEGARPTEAPVAVALVIHVTPPASWSKKKRAAALAGEVHPTSKPDLDNCVKAIFDACNDIVWGDDRQAVELSARKIYADAAGVAVRVMPVGGAS